MGSRPDGAQLGPTGQTSARWAAGPTGHNSARRGTTRPDGQASRARRGEEACKAARPDEPSPSACDDRSPGNDRSPEDRSPDVSL
eukprot:2467832-Prymnesium_polylepis.1